MLNMDALFMSKITLKSMVRFYIILVFTFFYHSTSIAYISDNIINRNDGGSDNTNIENLAKSNSLAKNEMSFEDIFRSTEFITTWETSIAGISGNNQINIPTVAGLTYNYTVDWGDGSSSSETGDAIHTYASPGTYTVSITGAFPRIFFNDGGDKDKLIEINQWGINAWTSMENAFYGCSNLSIPATDAPDLTNVLNINRIFARCQTLNDNLNHWDVSNVQFALDAFINATSFNQPLNDWDVSAMINMQGMFAFATNFDQPLDNWNTAALQNASYMFWGAPSFNQDISSWDMSGVLNVSNIFDGASSFNQNLGNWDISSMTNMSNSLNSTAMSTANYDATLEGWATLQTGETMIPVGVVLGALDVNYCNADASRTTLSNSYNWSISGDILECLPFISTWKTDNLGSSNDNEITIPTNPAYTYNYTVNWGDGTSSAETGNATHSYATAGTYTVRIIGDFPAIYFNNAGDKNKILAVTQWGTNSWASMESAFFGCTNLTVPASDSPDLNIVTSMENMFFDNTSLNDNLNHWDVSNVEILFRTFRGASSFNQPLNNWDVSAVISMHEMFAFAESFNQPLDNWNTASLDISPYMFWGAFDFNQDISTWDVSGVINMDRMFWDALSFDQDLSAWNIVNCTVFNGVFDNSNLSTRNYDKIVNAWSAIATQTNLVFGANGISFCNSEDARTSLIDNLLWNFVGDSKSCNPFITTWKTDNQGTSNDNQITIPIDPNLTYNYTVDWGDGSSSTETASATHTYATAGTYSVSISGDFPTIFFNLDGDRLKLLSVDQWGDNAWERLDLSFYGCRNLIVPATDTPNLTEANSIFGVFAQCTNLNAPSISNWDVSNVQQISAAFFGCSIFNQDLSSWDISSANSLGQMFSNASNFNQDLSSWDISNVNDMFNAFDGTGLSSKNYDKMLNSWALQSVQPNVEVGAQGIIYCDGAGARASLIENGWNFVEDVKECVPFAQYVFEGNALDMTSNGYDGQVTGAELTPGRFSIPENAYLFRESEDIIVL
jgi:surface protein